jgi:hypothetical protein
MTRRLDVPRWAWSIGLAFIAIVGMSVNIVRLPRVGYPIRLETDWSLRPLEGHFSGEGVMWLVVWAALALLVFKALGVRDTRVFRYAAGAAIVFAGLELLGAIVAFDNSLGPLTDAGTHPGTSLHRDLLRLLQLGKCLVRFAGFAIAFYAPLALVFNWLGGGRGRRWSLDFGRLQGLVTRVATWGRRVWRGHPGRCAVAVWAVICLSRVPYFLSFYPASMNQDSFQQLREALGTNPLWNHHPVASTMILVPFARFGQAVGNLNLGVGLFTCFQVAATSAAFTFMLVKMMRWGFPRWGVAATALMCALFPTWAVWSVTAMKDTMFSALFLCWVVTLIDATLNRRTYFRRPAHWAWMALFALTTTLLRSNGVYLVALATIVFVIFAVGQRRAFALIGAFAVGLSLLWNGPILTAMNVIPGNSKEALSLPLQQIQRTVKFDEPSLTQEERETLAEAFGLGDPSDLSEIANRYDPRLADGIKTEFSEGWFDTHQGEFLRLWWQLGKEHPAAYGTAILTNTFGYWYPEAESWTVQMRIFEPNHLGLSQDSWITPVGVKVLRGSSAANMRMIPGVSMLYSIGFQSWLVALAALALVFKRRYRALIPFTPLALMWLTALVSPVFGEYRYVLGMMFCVPMMVLLALAAPVGSRTRRRRAGPAAQA